MNLSIDVVGANAIALKLVAFGAKGSKALDDAIKITAIQATGEAKLAETAVQTARLRSSIHFEMKNTGGFTYSDKPGSTFTGSFQERAGNLEALVGTNVHYANKIEARLNFMNTAKVYASYELPAQCALAMKKIFIGR